MVNNDWQQLVLTNLKEIKNEQAVLRSDVIKLREEQAASKVNAKWEIRIMSTFWGVIMVGINYLIGRHGGH